MALEIWNSGSQNPDRWLKGSRNIHLFPFEKTSLYNDIDNIEVLDVFGMSPYGDDSLIEKINKMDYVTVYVYNKDISNETDEWERKLKCKHCLKDSREIIN